MKPVKPHNALARIVTALSHKRLQSFAAHSCAGCDPGHQLGRVGGDTCADSAVLAEVISRSIWARCASSACWSRRNCADALWTAAGVLALTRVATSSWTR